MVEEVKRTPEEELLAKAKAGEGSSAAAEKTDDDAGKSSEDLIKDLQDKLGEANKRASAAEYQRDNERAEKDSARKAATEASQNQVKTQEEALKSKLNAAKSKFEKAQSDWDEAFDLGDKAKLRSAQERLNDSQMELRGAEFEEKRFTDWKEKNKGEVTVSKSASKFGPKGDAWIEKNPEFNTNPEFRDEVYAADAVARARDIEIYSPEYFELIEKRLTKAGMREKPEADETAPAVAAKKVEKQASSSAAPVGRSGGSSSSSGSSKTTITLTPEMRRGAQIAFPEDYKKDPKATEEKYARYRMQIDEDNKAKRG